jgi:hypothetical protein
MADCFDDDDDHLGFTNCGCFLNMFVSIGFKNGLLHAVSELDSVPVNVISCTLHIRIFYDATSPGGLGPTYYRGFMITPRHTTLGRTPLGE